MFALRLTADRLPGHIRTSGRAGNAGESNGHLRGIRRVSYDERTRQQRGLSLANTMNRRR